MNNQMDMSFLYQKLLKIGLTLSGKQQDDAVEQLWNEFCEYKETVVTCERDRDILDGWWEYALIGAAREIVSRTSNK